MSDTNYVFPDDMLSKAIANYRKGDAGFTACRRALNQDLDKTASHIERETANALLLVCTPVMADIDKNNLMDGFTSTKQIRAKGSDDGEKNPPDHDPVNHPSHYTQYKDIEVIQLTEQMNFNLGNAVKYIARAGFKDPEKEIEDLQKAAWYLNREIERKQK